MVLSFRLSLPGALDQIEMVEKVAMPITSAFPQAIQEYSLAKWAIVDLLNQRYNSRLPYPFDLHHWLYYNEHDEVAYFLNEAGSNALNYSEHKKPSHFHLWLGKKGFIIGIEQQGKGFNAPEIDAEKRKENDGAAFDFFRNCRSTVFFDHAADARTVYLLFLITSPAAPLPGG